jgi:hypothetical protein
MQREYYNRDYVYFDKVLWQKKKGGFKSRGGIKGREIKKCVLKKETKIYPVF